MVYINLPVRGELIVYNIAYNIFPFDYIAHSISAKYI